MPMKGREKKESQVEEGLPVGLLSLENNSVGQITELM